MPGNDSIHPLSFFMKQRAIIIGGGPAGLTAAYELLTRTDILPIVLEANPKYVGGISKTVEYNGNRIDIGGHRFFSKVDRVMEWWQQFLPLQKITDSSLSITYQRQTRDISSSEQGPDPEAVHEVMLVRQRVSRIYFNKTFFPYPISLSVEVMRKLGVWRMLKIGVTYLWRVAFPIKPEKSLEDFYINRFGDELYKTFFESYTHKVWGVPCREISSEWGAQRVKGLSIVKALLHLAKQLLPKTKDILQKKTETSLIERFLYPKHGPGQMWEMVVKRVQELGGEIRMGERVVRLEREGGRIARVVTQDASGAEHVYEADIVCSTMPVRDVLHALNGEVPTTVRDVGDGLVYRDFITVGVLAKRLALPSLQENGLVPDTWIYIQEPDVTVGRVQIFNNWSPYLVRDPETIWIGLEYFCTEGDELWSRSDESMQELAKEELAKLGMVRPEDVLDMTVLREKKTYPAYFGTYHRFHEVRAFLDEIENFFPLGRNGMHRYNNQDHSMMTAMVLVDQLVAGKIDKAEMWAVNTEQEYHEKK